MTYGQAGSYIQPAKGKKCRQGFPRRTGEKPLGENRQKRAVWVDDPLLLMIRHRDPKHYEGIWSGLEGLLKS